MSIQRSSCRNKQRQLPPNAEKYCPDYIKFDQKARHDSKVHHPLHLQLTTYPQTHFYHQKKTDSIQRACITT